MPTICVAAGCSNQKDKAKGISLHVIPFFEDERPEAKRRRKKWVDFVKQKRAKWQPSKHSVICSVHFKPEDFERRFDCLQQGGKAPPRWLRKDEFGCCVFPTIHAVGKNTIGEPSKREKRMAIKAAMATQRTACSDQSPGKPSAKRAKHARVTATSPSVQSTTTCAEEVCKLVGSGDGSPENAQESSKVDASKQAEVIEPAEEAVEAVNKQTQDPAEGCSNCTVLSNKLRKLKNRIVSLEEKAKKWKASNRRSHYRIKGEYSVSYSGLIISFCGMKDNFTL
ncbi:PREDICTED: THAP domain-containing protein 5-like [Acropora digitifera]|uniref:THAP domain-containing protein 5-like n=1 Tax=Acropora digitifera TaxID=70779 RepID=UPI00077A9D1A|nr:PREDICTED: THAP domain-containing protein 5-like [Acropora digitifera]